MDSQFIKLIEEQKQSQDNPTLCKINIHYSVRGYIHNYCVDLNKRIKKITSTEIDLSEYSYQIPHLTLAMGYIDSEETFYKICVELQKFTAKQKPMSIGSTRPYLLKPKNDYIFMDTIQENLILKIKRELNNSIEHLLLPLEWNVVEATPHITVGYINKNQIEIETLLNSLDNPPNWTANAIAVSFCGGQGSCLGTIKSFELV